MIYCSDKLASTYIYSLKTLLLFQFCFAFPLINFNDAFKIWINPWQLTNTVSDKIKVQHNKVTLINSSGLQFIVIVASLNVSHGFDNRNILLPSLHPHALPYIVHLVPNAEMRVACTFGLLNLWKKWVLLWFPGNIDSCCQGIDISAFCLMPTIKAKAQKVVEPCQILSLSLANNTDFGRTQGQETSKWFKGSQHVI